MRCSRFLVYLMILPGMAGCGWFGGDDEPEEIKPNPLPKFNQEVRLDVVWSKKIGGGSGDRAIRLKPAVIGGRIFAASADGHVKALTTDTGRVVWDVQIKKFYSKAELAMGFTKALDAITGGVGAGGDLVVVGTGSGEIIALHQSDGSLAWRVSVSSEVLAAPQIDGDLVVVQTIDGKVGGFDAIDGTRRWIYTTNTPALTLRGTATPLIAGDFVVTAFANGRVAFLDKQSGLAAFDQRIAVAQGSSDLERLVDIDGAMVFEDGRIYVASFQGRLVSIELGSGRMNWAENISSVEGVGTGFGHVYLARADSQVTAFDADNGREIWNVDGLFYRDITSPVAIGSYIAVTDFEGYVHLLAQSDGRFVGRRKVDRKGIKVGLVSEGGRLYAMGDSGSLSAMEIH